MDRRTVLKGAALSLLTTTSLTRLEAGIRPSSNNNIPATLSGPSRERGHMVRRFKDQPPATRSREGIVIIGGGAGGLSAAYHLELLGHTNYSLYELEDTVGGNARSTSFKGFKTALGAHFSLPANPLNKGLLNFYDRYGVITGYGTSGLPTYNDKYLVTNPLNRIKDNTKWSSGEIPYASLKPEDHQALEKLDELILVWQKKKGRDGKPAFSSPIELSSTDPEILKLDQMSFKAFIDSQNIQNDILYWYLNDRCLDEYGGTMDMVSAWAGMHYFCGWTASEAHINNSENSSILSWPEGNDFLINSLRSGISPESINTGFVVMGVEKHLSGFKTKMLNTENNSIHEVSSDKVIFGTPMFVNKYIASDIVSNYDIPNYTPWLVSNIEIDKAAKELLGELSWINSSFQSEGMGYVNAQHISGRSDSDNYVITYYHPFTHITGRGLREWAYNQKAENWTELVLDNLELMHPGISSFVVSMGHHLWGHGMSIPSPGYVWGKRNRARCSVKKNIAFCHTDTSGLSTFEEAFYRGEQAAFNLTRSSDSSFNPV